MKAAFLVAMLLILPSLTYALPIKDLQPTTKCDNFNCTSWLDLTTIATTNQINNLKSIDLTSYLPKVSSYLGLKAIGYNITGSTLYIYGVINQSVYWTMDLNGYTLDPWWNLSASYLWDNPTTNGNDGGGGQWYYMWIKTNQSMNITYINLTSSAVNAVQIRNETGGTGGANDTMLKNVSTLNKQAWLNITLGVGDYAIILETCGSGPKFNNAWTFPNATYSGVRPFGYNFTIGGYTTGCGGARTNYSTGMWELEYILTQEPTSTGYFYDTNLYFNSTLNQNASYNYTQPILIVGNLTGNTTGSFNLSLFINGTFNTSGINTTSIVYNSSLGGIVPVILQFGGNASIAAFNKTYYLNISTPPIANLSVIPVYINVDLNNAPLVCLNDSYAGRNTTFYNNNTITPLAEVYFCEFGCDENFQMCKLSPLYQGFLSFGVLVGFIIILLLLDKVLKR